MKRPTLLIALFVAIAGGVAAAVVATSGPAKRFVMALQPISETEAVLLTRANSDPDERYWIQLVDAAKGVVWELETPNVLLETLGRAEVAFDADHVYVVTRGGGDREVLAIARSAPARISWRQTILPACGDEDANRDFGSALYAGPRVVGERLLVFSGCNTDLQLDVLERATGRRLWTRAKLEGRSGDPAPIDARTVFRAEGDRLVASYVFRTDVLDLVSGEAVWTDFDLRAACGVEGTGADAALLAVRDDDLVRVPLAADRGVVVVRKLPGDLTAVSCGRYRDRLVFVADGRDETVAYSVLPAAAEPDTVLWRTRLPASPGDNPDGSPPLSGVLPRFTTVLLRPGATLATLDLESGAVAGTVDAKDWQGQAFVTPGASVVANRSTSTIAAVDGATGVPRGAVTVAYDQFVLPQHVVGDTLWVSGNAWAAPDALPWATIDLRTMTATVTHGELPVTATPVAGHVPVAAQ